jgi:endo-1,4-beta-D-glucanase Y
MYVFYNDAGDNGDAITVSEAHGYGMVLTALMAGHDADAHAEFDALFAYFRAHPGRQTPALMAWQQVTGCRTAPDGGGTATDGDLDIAYALLLADAQWGSAGPIDYRAEALKTIAAIKCVEINVGNPSIKLGDWVTDTSKKRHDTRPSDFMPDHFRAFARATGDPLWTKLIDRGYAALDSLQTKHAPRTGLIPDFVRALNTAQPEPAPPRYLEGRHDGEYYYNSCRVPWRLGTDLVLTGEPRAKTVLERLNTFIVADSGGDPAYIHPGYRLDGQAIHDDYTSMSFTAPLAVGAMTSVDRQAWLDALWQNIVANPSDDDDYYGVSIKVQTLLVVSGNWWAP